MVTRLQVEVTNHSDRVLNPRFSVQREQPYPWLIESGPEVLQPGESATYVTRSGYPAVAFPASEGAQIVVTDGGSDYALREEVDIPPEPTFRDPDLAVNPEYKYWEDTSQLPAGWALSARPAGSGAVQMDTVDSREALVLLATSSGLRSQMRLSQQITFPGPFDIWVYPTASVSEPRRGAGYGLEFFDGHNRIWVLFGNADDRGFLDAQTAYIVIPTPLDQWSLQNVRLEEIYRELGLSLPAVMHRVQNDRSFQARSVELSLLLLSGGSESSRGVFGPIEQPPVQQAGTTDYLEQALQDPAEYYVGLGNEYRGQRNYDLALDAYETALGYKPESADALYGLGMAYLGLGEEKRAAASLEESLGMGPPRLQDPIAEAFFDLGEAHFWQDEGREAIAAYQRALDLGYERSFMAYKGLGWAHYNLHALEDARISFEKAIRAAPNQETDAVHLADALAGLGWVTLEAEGCDAAVSLFEQALVLAPDLQTAQQGLDRCSTGP
jgi:tetratricopeptide (TPR) repeat protein